MERDIKVGIFLMGLLQIALIVLKLCKVINWHWFFVLLPIIISIMISYGIFTTKKLVKGGK